MYVYDCSMRNVPQQKSSGMISAAFYILSFFDLIAFLFIQTYYRNTAFLPQILRCRYPPFYTRG